MYSRHSQYIFLGVILLPGLVFCIIWHRIQMENLRRWKSESADSLLNRELSWRIFRLSENYRSGCRLLLREYQEEQSAVIATCLQQSRQALPGVLEELGKTGNSLNMMYRLTRDAARGTGYLGKYCAERLEPVTAPVLQAEARMAGNFRLFHQRMRERRMQYLAELAVFQKEKQLRLPEDEPIVQLFGEQEIQKLVSARMGAALSVILEGIFIRDTWRILHAFFLRGTTAAGCAAADGPLPFGDMLGLGLTVWGLGETAWDFHQASTVLPDQLRRTMEARLRSAELGLLQRMEQFSEEVTELYLKQSEQIEMMLQKKLKE